MDDYRVVVNKSTVPVGHPRNGWRAVIEEELKTRRVEAAVPAFVSNPEFLKEGAAVNDFMRPDRIVGRQQRRSAPRRSCASCTRRSCAITTAFW